MVLSFVNQNEEEDEVQVYQTVKLYSSSKLDINCIIVCPIHTTSPSPLLLSCFHAPPPTHPTPRAS